MCDRPRYNLLCSLLYVSISSKLIAAYPQPQG